MVEGRKTLRELAPEIEKILSSAQLIVFCGKDVPAFLKKSGITLPQAKTPDLAHEFSEAHGAYDPATDFWKACTLEECVTHFGGKAPETTAASEAEAAAFTFRELLRDPWYGKPRTKPLKSIEVATGKTFWDYGDEEGRLAGKDAASHASKEKRAEEDGEESETDRELREAERSWLKPTPAKFVILALGAIGFTVAGKPEGAAVTPSWPSSCSCQRSAASLLLGDPHQELPRLHDGVRAQLHGLVDLVGDRPELVCVRDHNNDGVLVAGIEDALVIEGDERISCLDLVSCLHEADKAASVHGYGANADVHEDIDAVSGGDADSMVRDRRRTDASGDRRIDDLCCRMKGYALAEEAHGLDLVLDNLACKRRIDVTGLGHKGQPIRRLRRVFGVRRKALDDVHG